MERSRGPVNEVRPDGKIRWRKEGRGIFRLKNHIYRPREIFWARPDEISQQFRDLIKPVDSIPAERPIDDPVDLKFVIKPAYTKVKRETSNFWDIFDGQGKQINEKALREDQADEYLESLTK